MQPIHIEQPPKLPRRQRLLFKILYGIFAVVIVGAFVILFWILQSPTVLVAKNTPFPVRPGTNNPGQVEYVYINYCKVRGAYGSTVVRMVGQKSIIRLPWPPENSAPSCLDTELPIVIPQYATGDTYYFDFAITYRINTVKSTTVDLHSASFTIEVPSRMLQ